MGNDQAQADALIGPSASAHPVLLALRFALGDGVALVVVLFSFANADQDLSLSSIVEVDLERDERQASFLNTALDEINLLALHEQLAVSSALKGKVRGEGVRLDVSVVQPQFVVHHSTVGVCKRSATKKERFDLASGQHDASLVRVEDLIVKGRPAVLNDRGALRLFFLGGLLAHAGAQCTVYERIGKVIAMPKGLLVAGFGLLLVILGLLLTQAGCAPAGEQPKPEEPAQTSGSTDTKPAASGEKPSEPASPAKVKITDVKVGTGETAADGDLLVVQYRGTFTDGKEFDSNMSQEREPFNFRLGEGSVIPGWDQGMKGMKVGGTRKLEIPWALAYGEQGRPPQIPAKADLNFEVKLLYVVKKGDEGAYDAKDIKVGEGPAVKAGDRVKVHYVGKFLNGKEFDSSRPRGQAFDLTVGQGQVIRGWDEGLVGMKKGGVRRLVLPPALAYGEQGNQGIPPNSVLDFEIELLEIVKPN